MQLSRSIISFAKRHKGRLVVYNNSASANGALDFSSLNTKI